MFWPVVEIAVRKFERQVKAVPVERYCFHLSFGLARALLLTLVDC